MADIPYLPPELRRYIALFCDRPTLARLLPTDRLWAAECEPVLYSSIGLRIHNSDYGISLACLRLLASSPSKAALVKTLLIDYLDTPPAPVVSAGHELLFHLRNLVDFRIRAPYAPEEGSDAKLLQLLARPDCPLRLHTLHLPLADRVYPDLVCDALKAQAATLRVLAITTSTSELSLYASHIAKWTSLLRPDCAFFSFSREASAGRRPAPFVHGSDTSKISLIATSLEDDPSGELSPALVDSLDIQVTRLPDAALAKAIGTHFPNAKFVELLLPVGCIPELTPAAVAQAVAYLPRLFMLHLSHGVYGVAPRMPTRTRVAIARAVYSAGCSELYEVHFPDLSRLQFHAPPSDGSPSSWYDPVTLSDGDSDADAGTT